MIVSFLHWSSETEFDIVLIIVMQYLNLQSLHTRMYTILLNYLTKDMDEVMY